MYYPHTPTVIGKRRADGRVYYYLVESARVGGKPRIVSQQYLGSAADHRRFWEAMDRLSETDLAMVETELSRRIVAEYGLTCRVWSWT